MFVNYGDVGVIGPARGLPGSLHDMGSQCRPQAGSRKMPANWTTSRRTAEGAPQS
jgi:hypothetical protein